MDLLSWDLCVLHALLSVGLIRFGMCFALHPPMKGGLVGVWEDGESVLQQDHHTRHWQEQGSLFLKTQVQIGDSEKFFGFLFFSLSVFAFCFVKEI